jgi:hypothetical protein
LELKLFIGYFITQKQPVVVDILCAAFCTVRVGIPYI